MDTYMYEVELLDRNNEKHSIWGYGVPKIIDPEEPADAQAVHHLFPHVPDSIFDQIPKRRVDVLVGLNYNG